jgi:TOTE conflict system, Archaeo-Eukaryotic Primase domain/Primase C terminal 1 (PriCT-1)
MSHADRMFALFRGLSKAHGTYREEEFDEDKEKQEIKRTASTQHTPPTAELWQRHIDGEYHLGIIPIDEDSNCLWGAVDIDDYSIDHADLVDKLAKLAIPAIVCKTKSKGAHVYVFFSEPIPAPDVIRKLRELAVVLGRGDQEVFPKQDRIVGNQVGNWINMPYFANGSTKCPGVRPNGMEMSLSQFVAEAERSRMSPDDFRKLSFRKRSAGLEDGPPCLEHLASIKLKKGQRDNGLFDFATYLRRKFPEGWEAKLQEINHQVCEEPMEHAEVEKIAQNRARSKATYKCKSQPCVLHCNMPLCRTREFGIGTGGEADIIDNIVVYGRDPPLYLVTLKIGGTVECDYATLSDAGRLNIAAGEQLVITLPLYTKQQWHAQITKAMNEHTKLDAPPEVGRTGQFFELLRKFCNDRHAAESMEDILNGKPFRDEEDGRVYFRLSDLHRFLDREKFRKLNDNQVAKRIKDMGGVEGKDWGKKFHRIGAEGANLWWVPVSKIGGPIEQIRTPPIEEGPV